MSEVSEVSEHFLIYYTFNTHVIYRTQTFEHAVHVIVALITKSTDRSIATAKYRLSAYVCVERKKIVSNIM